MRIQRPSLLSLKDTQEEGTYFSKEWGSDGLRVKRHQKCDQENANENYDEVLLHSSYNDCYSKLKKITNTNDAAE